MTLLEPNPRLREQTSAEIFRPASAINPFDALSQAARLSGSARGRFDAGQFIAFIWNERNARAQTHRIYSLSDRLQEQEHDGFIEVLEVEKPDFEGISVGDERLERLGLIAGRELVRQLVVEEYGRVICYAALPE